MNEQRVQNLCDITIRSEGGPVPLVFPGVETRIQIGGRAAAPSLEELTVVFNRLEDALISRIKGCDAVFGCVAWPTSEPILRALAEKKAVSLLVQKEDFLRPDLASDKRRDWKLRLRSLYERLPDLPNRLCDTWGNLRFECMSCAGDPDFQPVRCVGISPGNGQTKPNMHHKFVLFADAHPGAWKEDPEIYVPHTVWTGSYNFTQNSNCSFENGVIIREEGIVAAYFQVFGELMAISEPLDWESRWVAPEWRIGT